MGLFPVLALLVGGADIERGLLVQPSPTVEFYFENRHETQSFALFGAEGQPSKEGLGEFSHFMRCFRTGRQKPMNPRTVQIVLEAAEHFGASQVVVISGYRARPYGSPHSRHFLGHAMDIRLPGVSAKKLAQWIWDTHRQVGVGFYPNQEFVHVDVRDVDVRWVDRAHHGESGHARYFVRMPERPVAEVALPNPVELAQR
jgi:uncharacterized protein YcbK (DUF882 family)